MFNYFHCNKLRYEKGQLAPFFILLLVVIVIMAMVLMNISKVAMIKTESSNAADSAALASGSVMANLFNSIAQSGTQLEAGYWEYFATTSISMALIITLTLLATTEQAAGEGAEAAAIPEETTCLGGASCAAIAPMALALSFKTAADVAKIAAVALAESLVIAYATFHTAQYFIFHSIKKAAKEGRFQAISLGSKYGFINSNLGSKLKDGEAPDDSQLNLLIKQMRADPVIQKRAQKYSDQELKNKLKNNYRKSFSGFLEGIDGKSNLQNWNEPNSGTQHRGYRYQWLDGEARSHSVAIAVETAEVDDFDLKVMVMPFLAELGLLNAVRMKIEGAILQIVNDSLGGIFTAVACGLNSCAYNFWTAAICFPLMVGFCAAAVVATVAGKILSILSLAFLTLGIAYIEIAWAGLAPGPVISSAAADSFMFTICWIEDINHDRKVKVYALHQHQGAELANPLLWRTEYPDSFSFSIVDFSGKGEIHDPVYRHDASIIATDGNEKGYNPCDYARRRAAALSSDIKSLSANIAILADRAQGVINMGSGLQSKQDLLDITAGQPRNVKKPEPHDPTKDAYIDAGEQRRQDWEAAHPESNTPYGWTAGSLQQEQGNLDDQVKEINGQIELYQQEIRRKCANLSGLALDSTQCPAGTVQAPDECDIY
ncbi:MAG: Tad domain-containing protein [Candidatus Omnitrophota bacterium]|nr:Tad domain-containing protein [Candidatus Omnitrophota bacterium]